MEIEELLVVNLMVDRVVRKKSLVVKGVKEDLFDGEFMVVMG